MLAVNRTLAPAHRRPFLLLAYAAAVQRKRVLNCSAPTHAGGHVLPLATDSFGVSDLAVLAAFAGDRLGTSPTPAESTIRAMPCATEALRS